MATKSIKYKTLRIIAVFIAAVTLFLSGLFACFSIKGAFFYNRYETIGKYTDTDAFRKLMNSVEYELINAGEYASCPESELGKTSGVKEREAENKEIETSLKNACDLLDKSGVEVFVDGGNRYRYMYKSEGGTFYYSYDGSFISKSEFEALRYADADEENATVPAEEYYDEDGNLIDDPDYTDEIEGIPEPDSEEIPEVLTTAVYDGKSGVQAEISEALKTVWNLTNGLNYGEKPTEKLIESAIKDKGAEPGNYYDEYTLEKVNELSGVNYAIFYKTTGKVYTNCGVKAGDTADEILRKTGSVYAEIYDGGKYSVIGATEKKVFPLYGSLDLYPAYLSYESIDNIVDKAYFAYDASNAKGMPGVGLMAYNGYVNSSARHDVYTERSLATYGILAIVCFAVALICCLFCVITAGKTNSGEVKIRFFDRVPFAINFVLSAGIVAGFAALVIGSAYFEHDLYELFVYNSFPTGLAMALAPYISHIQALLFALGVLIAFGLLGSIVRNIKNKSFFKHTLAYCIITPVKFIFRKIRALFHKGAEKAKMVYATDYAYGNGKKFLIISGIVIGGVILFNFILLFCGGLARSGFAFLVGVFLNLFIAAALILFVICFDRIASGVAQIKGGSLTCNINTRFMPGFMRSTAEDISKIRQGLQEAVNQAVKDQSMKTELITNVTHDLKTPLTSIITYVDLIKKEGLDGENSAEYLDVIDEKSQKLKKLIDDLVQASKASSGAMEVNCQTLDLCEFAVQIAGEYKEELKGAGIDTVVSCPETPVYVWADPALVGRVFENLIGNIKKYAMPNTRAFIVVSGDNSSGTIVFKNVSASPLITDSQKLTERFYRGDSARAGEGSGLGLSIAKDLCALQGGSFRIELDGDMFKAYVTLKKNA